LVWRSPLALNSFKSSVAEFAVGTLDELRVRSGEERGNLETVFLELTEDADRDRDLERDFAVL
jgi:hypothetical protein